MTTKELFAQGNYSTENYLNRERFISYYNQLKIINDIHPHNILEIGKGNGFIERNLPKQITYESVDNDKTTNPTYLCDLKEFVQPKVYDLVIAFEILEHIGYREAINNLRQLIEFNKCVAISIPERGYNLVINNKHLLSRPRFIKETFCKEHLWEINVDGLTLKDFLNDVKVKPIVSFVDSKDTYRRYFIFKGSD